ncbi:MAG: 30S ribosomal protein S9 [bacterium]|nr:30S ribosomal protein S9 [bacterium]MDD5755804.1 30S ribosomal protein S9 [bacterium]
MAETIQTVGRRKNSIARAALVGGQGLVTINGKPMDEYFQKEETLIAIVMEPLKVIKAATQYDISIQVYGGGTVGQAGAVRHSIARALDKIDPSNHGALKKAGFLTRDPRVVERKKPGRPKARKRFQFSKR